jgi:GNAT superfamily N-acetyltransferase
VASTDCPKFEIEPLADKHLREAFSCGHSEIDSFFANRALIDHAAYKVRVNVAIGEECGNLLGFHSLAIGALAPKAIGGRIKRKFGNWPIPMVYLSAVAVSDTLHGRGVGSALMLDVFERTAAIAELAGTACLTLDAVDEDRAQWYESLQFERFAVAPDGKVKMFIPIGTVQDALRIPSDDNPAAV